MLSLVLLYLSALGAASFHLNSRTGGDLRSNGRFGRVATLSSPSLNHNSARSLMYSSPAEIELESQVDVDFVRRWYLKEYNKRPDVNILDELCSVPELIAEVWKAVLISVRVMEKDQDLSDYRSLTVFTGLQADIADATMLQSIQSAVAEIDKSQSSLLLQPNFKRTLTCRVLPPSERTPKPVLILEVDTRREFSPTPDFSDIDDFTPSTEDALNNDIEDFPFPTVYDFISEINRPPDPATMAELEFSYKIYDFKYDLNAMAKKKNPQDVVNNINCKLTRLAKWKRVLENSSKGDVDAFSDTLGWSEKVKLKYQSLKAIAATDTKKALDTQYDKRAVFLNIIDQWSDRLKRSFKFTYFQSTREPENFNEAILNSVWRKDLSRTVALLAKAPFMDFEGPDFEPGNIKPLFADDRVLLWDSNYPVDVALAEMMSWQRYTDKARGVARVPLMGEFGQHTYSRGLITERVLADTYAGLSKWLTGSKTDTPQSAPKDNSAESTLGHHDAFKSGLEGINKLSRERSTAELKAVKEVYSSDFNTGKELVEWWTEIVRNFDRAADMEAVAIDRRELWSAIIEDVVTDPTAFEATQEVSIAEAQKQAEENVRKWRISYKEVCTTAEKVESHLKWKEGFEHNDVLAYCETMKKDGALSGETITINFDNNSDTFVFVAPRYFRGIGMDEELVSIHHPGISYTFSRTLLLTSSPVCPSGHRLHFLSTPNQ